MFNQFNSVLVHNTGNKDLCGKPLNSCSDTAGNESRTVIPNPEPAPPGKGKNILVPVLIAVAVVIFASIVALLFIRNHRRKRFQPIVPDKQAKSHSSADFKESQSIDLTSDKGDNVELNFVREDRGGFSLQDLLRASAVVLGSGSFGSSYKAMILDGPSVVVKRFRNMNNVGKQEFKEQMQRLGSLTHPNLLPLAAFYYRKDDKFLVYDFAENGSLATHLHGMPFLFHFLYFVIVTNIIVIGCVYYFDWLPSWIKNVLQS